ncbi:MAG TPA: endonuclease/exonuclease/phosphatase family protein [Terriglobales bacterium]|nr:endonuclease/exonuclease/phosphatase family protein [Terriglobales bacterium]
MNRRLFRLCWLFVFVCISIGAFCQQGERALKVLTYNIHHANPPSKPGVIDVKAIAKVISESGADLVALQEIDVRTLRSGKELDQAAELAKLTGMNFYFAKSLDFEGGDYGLAILSRFPISQGEALPLPLEGGEHRALGVVTIEPAPGKKILFADTHLDLRASNRVLQVKFIKDYFAKQDLPVILCGDFNSTPDSDTIRSLDQMFQRSAIASGLTFPMIKPDREIDFVMVRPAEKFSVKNHLVIPEEYASDHRPVLINLSY